MIGEQRNPLSWVSSQRLTAASCATFTSCECVHQNTSFGQRRHYYDTEIARLTTVGGFIVVAGVDSAAITAEIYVGWLLRGPRIAHDHRLASREQTSDSESTLLVIYRESGE